MNRSVRGVFLSVVVGGIVYVVMALTENELATDLAHEFPIVADHVPLLLGVLATLLLLVFVGLLVVQDAHENNPWSHLWSNLQLFLNIVAGILSAACAILINDIPSIFDPLVQFIRAHQPQSGVILLALVAIVAFGVPLTEHIIKGLNLRGLRDAKKLLYKLQGIYNRHLEYFNLVPLANLRLAVEMKPGDVQSPISLPAPESSLGTIAKVRHFFDAIKTLTLRQVLLLAGPGGGKSTQLYLLGQAFVDEALPTQQPDPNHVGIIRRFWRWLRQTLRRKRPHEPIPPHKKPHYEVPDLPVILDLSTWPANQQALKDWLIDEVVRIYNVHRGTARKWFKDGKLLPLLDALDVMEEAMRPLCVKAVNKYLRDFPTRPLVVCCRDQEYRAIKNEQGIVKLNLRVAIELPLLAEDLVLTALTNAGAAPDLIVMVGGDPDLRWTLRTPLLLSIAIGNLLNNATRSIESPATVGADESERRKQWRRTLFKGYIPTMLRRHNRPEEEDYPTAQSLGWMGYELWRTDALTFYMDNLQREYLPSRKHQADYNSRVSRIGYFIKFTVGPALGLIAAIVVSVIYSLDRGKTVSSFFGPDDGSHAGTISRLIIGLIGGVGVGLGIGKDVDPERPISLGTPAPRAPEDPVQQTRWQRFVARVRRLRGRDVQSVVIIATLVGALAGLVAAFVNGRSIGGMSIGLFGALGLGLCVGVIVGVVVGPESGLRGKRRAYRNPDGSHRDALRKSIRILLFYSLIGAIGGGLFVGLVIFVATWLSLVPQFGDAAITTAIQNGLDAAKEGAILGGLGFGVFVGLGVALGNGGADWLQHHELRKVLADSGVVPADIVKFLDRASSYTLLRQRGNGYTFIVMSESLRDYFANEYEEIYADKFAPPARTTLSHRHRIGQGQNRCSVCQHRRSRMMRWLTSPATFKIPSRPIVQRPDER